VIKLIVAFCANVVNMLLLKSSNQMNDVNRSQHLNEAVEHEASDQLHTVNSIVLRNVENLPLNVVKHALTLNGNEGASARNNTGAIGQQLGLTDQTLAADAAALTVTNITSERMSTVHGNNNAVPVIQPSTTVFNLPSMHKPRLLPPTAFLSRADGTPIIDTEIDHGQTSVFGKQKQMLEREEVSLNAQVVRNSKTKDTAAGLAGGCSQQLESECDRMADLLYVRKTLNTFADNKKKLKYEAFFPWLIVNLVCPFVFVY